MLGMLFANPSHLNWCHSIVMSMSISRTSVNTVQLTNVMRSTIGKMQRMIKSLSNLRADSDFNKTSRSHIYFNLNATVTYYCLEIYDLKFLN